LLSETKEGQFPPQAWTPFWKLVDALGKWFDIHFTAKVVVANAPILYG
jgi:hypothetical protein